MNIYEATLRRFMLFKPILKAQTTFYEIFRVSQAFPYFYLIQSR